MKQVMPHLKRIHSPDVYDLHHPDVSSGQPFYIFVQAMFGMEELDGEESFGFMCCNRLWMDEQKVTDIELPKYCLVLDQFNYAEIARKLNEIAQLCRGQSWSEVANELAKFGFWEFDGYIP